MHIATKLISIDTWQDRIKCAWLCLIGKAVAVGIIVLDKEFYKD